MMEIRGSRRVAWSSVIAVGLMVTSAAVGHAQDWESPELAEYIRSHYTKFEYRVPMRDGVKLFTAVYTPIETSKSYPFMMLRTPYACDPYGANRYPQWFGPTADFAREGYIFVCQDVRGRYMSEGEFVNMRPHVATKSGPQDVDESTDTYDTIEWLLANVEGHNGRVGQWGNSYPGFYSSAGMIDGHPALKAVSANAPIADWYWDDMHHHGAFTLALSFPFFASFGLPRPEPTTEQNERFDFGTPDGYQFFLDLGPVGNVEDELLEGSVPFWTEMSQHPNYDDFWQSRDILPHLKNISAAVLTVGGLFDAEDLYGPLHTYRAIEDNNPGIFNVLVMGPWSHGAWLWRDGETLGPADFGFPTAEVFRERVMIPFFRHFLKGEGELDLPEAWIFETGANRWREFDTVAAERPRERHFLSRRRRRAVGRQARRRRSGLRRVRQRPGQPGALHARHHHPLARRVHGGGPALRRTAARRAGLPVRALGAGCDPGRPDHCAVVGLHQRQRCRLGGQADRRVPGPAAGL